MSQRKKLYEGKAKILYQGPEPGTIIQHFKDDATAFNAQKHEVIEGKGVLNNRISEHIFIQLDNLGIPTHFIKSLNMREQLVQEVDVIPIEVVVRNFAAGSLVKRLGLEERGTPIKPRRSPALPPGNLPPPGDPVPAKVKRRMLKPAEIKCGIGRFPTCQFIAGDPIDELQKQGATEN